MTAQAGLSVTLANGASWQVVQFAAKNRCEFDSSPVFQNKPDQGRSGKRGALLWPGAARRWLKTISGASRQISRTTRKPLQAEALVELRCSASPIRARATLSRLRRAAGPARSGSRRRSLRAAATPGSGRGRAASRRPAAPPLDRAAPLTAAERGAELFDRHAVGGPAPTPPAAGHPDIGQRHLVAGAAAEAHALGAGAPRPAHQRAAAPAQRRDLNLHAVDRNRKVQGRR